MSNELAPERLPSASVVIATYSFDRWKQLIKAVESVRAQTVLPKEILVCVDYNDDLLAQCREQWPASDSEPPVRVLANTRPRKTRPGGRRGYSGGDARNMAADAATGEVIVILDDDAWAEPDWLELLLAPYADANVVAVGGAPLAEFQSMPPTWFPSNFNWVFGCAYDGLPTSLGPTSRLIGANMSVRATAFRELGGFRSSDFDDLDMCTRLAFRYSRTNILFEPKAVVHHYVPVERTTWDYFWRRCYRVNRDKVRAFELMGEAFNLSAERHFVVRALSVQTLQAFRRLAHGDAFAAAQLGAMCIGILMAGLGHAVGRLQILISKQAQGEL